MELVLLALIAVAVVFLLKRKPNLLSGHPDRGHGTAPRFRHVTGTVTGLSTYSKNDHESTTEVSPDGIVTLKTYNSATIVQSLFILSDDGTQTPLKFWGLEIPVADGQRVTVSYGDFPKKSRPVFLRNHATGTTYPIFHTPLDLAIDLGEVRSVFDILLITVAICAALSAFGWLVLGKPIWILLAVMLLPVIAVALMVRRKAYMKGFQALLASEKPRISAPRTSADKSA